MKSLPDSLSVVITIHNDANGLTERVTKLLELVGDLVTEFEVLIFDNGSTDGTEDVADELSHIYPQVRVKRLPTRIDAESLVTLALKLVRCDVVIVYDEDSKIREDAFRQMWQLRGDERLIVARPTAATPNPSLVERLASWGSRIDPASIEQSTEGGVQMIRRRAFIPRPHEAVRTGERRRPLKAPKT